MHERSSKMWKTVDNLTDDQADQSVHLHRIFREHFVYVCVHMHIYICVFQRCVHIQYYTKISIPPTIFIKVNKF